MKICLTGASSFTGYWIARTLADRGHHVIANLGSSEDVYDSPRQRRIAGLKHRVDCRFGVSYGSPDFQALIAREAPTILALHGAEVTNYRSWDFDPLRAAQRNTVGARALFEGLGASGGHVIATGSVFEPFEGIGDPGYRAFNPYGLSKHLSYEIFRMEAARVGIPLSKFVIPNPFGVLEEQRFTYYLVSQWAAGKVPSVGTPDYVRDNIHVDLLAQSYAVLVDRLLGHAGERMRPSGYVESQGQFARRFAAEMEQRTGKVCRVAFGNQTDFSEPRIRVNDMPARVIAADWDEQAAWDAVAAYYNDFLCGNATAPG